MQHDDGDATFLDARIAPRRLKEGLIPHDTGIYLQIEEGPGKGRVYGLSDGGVYLIGRDGVDIPLQDKKASRKHAEIGLYGTGAFFVRDLASTNGTRLNGKRIAEKADLKPHDTIEIGDTKMRLYVVEGTVPLSG